MKKIILILFMFSFFTNVIAADNGKGGVTLVTLDGDIEPGSEVR